MYCHLLERFFDDYGAVPVTDNLNLDKAAAPGALAAEMHQDALRADRCQLGAHLVFHAATTTGAS